VARCKLACLVLGWFTLVAIPSQSLQASLAAMNMKLRKPSQPSTASANASSTKVMSRTMQLAISGTKVSQGVDASGGLQRTGIWFSAPAAAVPHTKVEQYWATRAFVAETLLSVRDRHQDELAEIRRTEGEKRERELSVILHANDKRQGRMERMMVVCLVVLLGFMAWLVTVIAPGRDAKSKPSHFTIPILSPFASVVEHETGVLGTKVVAIFGLVIGIAVYMAVRRRWPTG